MTKVDNKRKFIGNLVWKLMERIGTRGITIIIGIVLARLLYPEDYGAIAIINVFINIAQSFVSGGFSNALVQKKNTDLLDFSSVFYLSLSIASIMYLLLFFGSPFIANYYDMQILTPAIRVVSLGLFFGSFNSIQNAIIEKKMYFKKLLISSLGAALLSGVVGIIMAYRGFGVWALVVQHLVNQISVCIIMWFNIKWRPMRVFSFIRIKALFSYGWKIFAGNMINTLYNNLRSMFIGKKFTASDLGFYDRGKQIPQVIGVTLSDSLKAVMLPMLSSEQDDLLRIKTMTRRMMQLGSFVIFPAMAGLAAMAKPMTLLLLNTKWLPIVPIWQLYCISYAFYVCGMINIQAFNSIGRSDLYLKYDGLKKVIGILILLITVFFFDSVIIIAVGSTLAFALTPILNAYPNSKYIKYSYKEQLSDLLPHLLVSLIMFIIVWTIQLLDLHYFATLIIQAVIGVISYTLLSSIFRLKSYIYAKDIILKSLKNRSIRR